MNSKELYNRIQSLIPIAAEIRKKEPEAVDKIRKVYKAVFGNDIKFGCKNCVTQAYIKLTSLSLKNLQEMADAKFKMKKGLRIQYPAFSPNFYTRENMTDAIASKLLKENDSMIKYFEDFPKDKDGNLLLEKSSKDPEASKKKETGVKVKELSKMTKTELETVYLKEVGKAPEGKPTNPQLIEAIESARKGSSPDPKSKDHTVTAEDLESKPEWLKENHKEGDVIQLPVE